MVAFHYSMLDCRFSHRPERQYIDVLARVAILHHRWLARASLFPPMQIFFSFEFFNCTMQCHALVAYNIRAHVWMAVWIACEHVYQVATLIYVFSEALLSAAFSHRVASPLILTGRLTLSPCTQRIHNSFWLYIYKYIAQIYLYIAQGTSSSCPIQFLTKKYLELALTTLCRLPFSCLVIDRVYLRLPTDSPFKAAFTASILLHLCELYYIRVLYLKESNLDCAMLEGIFLP